MQLASGIPTLAQLDALKRDPLYQSHLQFNQGFLDQHAAAMAGYGRHWGLNPYKLWSRRWEYPYVAQALVNFASRDPLGRMNILDAGSGVTYFPYYIIEQVPRAQFTCVDYDPSYSPMFERINLDRKTDRVRFMQASLQKLPLEDGSLDAVCCISVLEHTDNYGEIIREFARVLRPGGAFVLTFDLSLDDKFTLSRSLAKELLGLIGQQFDFAAGFDPDHELATADAPGILRTDHVQRTEPELLPWSFPVRVYKAAQDLIQGKGWTAGFRLRTVYCVTVTKK